MVGGKAYEARQCRDIIEDVLLACRESLTSGALNGAYRGLLAAVNDVIIKSDVPVDILRHLKDPLLEFSCTLLKDVAEDHEIEDPTMCINLETSLAIPFVTAKLIQCSDHMILQSKSSCVAFLDRVCDVIPKILYTDRIFVPNAINEKE